MVEVLFRLIFVWFMLHIILFFVEWYRYKHCGLSWDGFKMYGMLGITYDVLFADFVLCMFAIAGGLLYWIFEPIIH